MQYLGHTSMETTQKYLKNILIEGNEQQMLGEEHATVDTAEIREKIEPKMKPKRKNRIKLTEEANLKRLRKAMDT